MKRLLISLMVAVFLAGMVSGAFAENPKVVMQTNMGQILLELYPDKAPITVKNFLEYVEEGYYDGTIFHRVINDFMIQGGGFDKNMNRKKTKDPIKNEADNGLANDRGTIAMARTMVVDSATSQFFINVKDNAFLNFRDKTQKGYGYAVFGKVVDGMPVVDKIKRAATGVKNGMRDVPVKPVIIEKMYKQ